MRFLSCIICCGVLGLLTVSEASASSLDDLYRDIIRSDNRGYLPLFVKNRHAPVTLATEEDFTNFKEEDFSQETAPEAIRLSTQVKDRSALAKARQLQWLKTIAAIKSNQVTPLELEDVTSRAKENDPKAIEILAWMYTKGVGVSKDFVEAFALYKKAAQLKVANANRNALLVYRSMTEEQRRKIKNNL